ncbi:MAG: ABC transporter permease [Synergistaceae bacterium]|nr:ABC transporter permease [Synergistaceae bacterium]
MSDLSNKNWKKRMFVILDKAGILLALFIMVIIFSLMSNVFLTSNNLLTIFLQVAVYSLIAFGISFVLIAGGIDLSSGAIIGLSGMIGALVIIHTSNMWWGFMACLATGFFCGLVNGLLVTKLKLVPFIITLGTMYIFRGLIFIINSGKPASLRTAGEFIGKELFFFIGTGRVFGIVPFPVMIVLIVALITQLILKKTRYARELFAVGSNPEAARLSGINTDWVSFRAYIICGLICSLAGFLLTARMSTAQVNAGSSYELEGISASVMGGVSISGGAGTIFGAFSGALLMGTLRNGLNLNGVDSFWQQVIVGAVIILAVYIDKVRTTRSMNQKPDD